MPHGTGRVSLPSTPPRPRATPSYFLSVASSSGVHPPLTFATGCRRLRCPALLIAGAAGARMMTITFRKHQQDQEAPSVRPAALCKGYAACRTSLARAVAGRCALVLCVRPLELPYRTKRFWALHRQRSTVRVHQMAITLVTLPALQQEPWQVVGPEMFHHGLAGCWLIVCT